MKNIDETINDVLRATINYSMPDDIGWTRKTLAQVLRVVGRGTINQPKQIRDTFKDETR